MSLVGRRIRRWNDDEAVVLEVAFDLNRHLWYALVLLDLGHVDSWELHGCAVVSPKQKPYMPPPPTAIPGPGVSSG